MSSSSAKPSPSGTNGASTAAEGKSVTPSAPSGKKGVVKTTRERAEEKRLEKLAYVNEQLESGSLVIRQMTEEERGQYPVRPRPPQRGRR
jgi:hypothetical protein